jgi:arylsulfatase A-like enzyme
MRSLSSPGLYDAMEREVGVRYADGIDETIAGDELRGRFAAHMIESRRPALMLAYFTGLDHEQHGSGPFSPASYATLERIDTIVGALVQAARRAYRDNAVVAIVSDHGFQATNRAVNLLAQLRAEGLVTFPETGDKPTAWAAMVWGGGGSTAVVLKDTADAAIRRRVGGLLAKLAADSASGIERVIDSGELARRGGFPGAAFLVNLKPGYTTGGNPRAPLVADVSNGGAHGYLPDLPAMRATFVAAGPGIPAGKSLGLIDQRAIAPTLARVLGVGLPGAEVAALWP